VGISPYLRRLRHIVGHELLVVPSVGVLVWDEEDRLLLVRNAETGLWQTVGGSVEPDESPQAAAIREADEEAGLTISIVAIRAVLGGPEFRLTYPNGDLVSYVSTIFDARLVGGDARPDMDETDQVAWFPAGELGLIPVSSFTRALLKAAAVIPTDAWATTRRSPSA
jgi:8-oxo-dGTP pyrophosphatase MutT (NUDIX family)